MKLIRLRPLSSRPPDHSHAGSGSGSGSKAETIWRLDMRSMTGFGQASWQGDGRRLSVEVRSVNQRFLDVKLALPRECQAWEAPLRELVSGVAERGKVEVTVFRAGSAADDFTV